jgi:hypothetical protein
LAAVAVVVVAAVADDPRWPSLWPAAFAAHGRNTIDERDELGDVVAVAAGQRAGERDPRRVDEEVML